MNEEDTADKKTADMLDPEVGPEAGSGGGAAPASANLLAAGASKEAFLAYIGARTPAQVAADEFVKTGSNRTLFLTTMPMVVGFYGAYVSADAARAYATAATQVANGTSVPPAPQPAPGGNIPAPPPPTPGAGPMPVPGESAPGPGAPPRADADCVTSAAAAYQLARKIASIFRVRVADIISLVDAWDAIVANRDAIEQIDNLKLYDR